MTLGQGILFKVNNRNTIAIGKIYSRLTIRAPERRHWRRVGSLSINLNKYDTLFWYSRWDQVPAYSCFQYVIHKTAKNPFSYVFHVENLVFTSRYFRIPTEISIKHHLDISLYHVKVKRFRKRVNNNESNSRDDWLFLNRDF